MQDDGSSGRRDTTALIALVVSIITLCLGDNLYNQYTGHSIFSATLPKTQVVPILPTPTISLITNDLFSSINSTNAFVRFFECGEEIASPDQRVYQDRFYKGDTRYICAELSLSYPPPGRRVDFTLHFVIFGSDGSILIQSDRPSFVLPDWSGSLHTTGWGAAYPGSWATGIYTTVFSNNNIEIARATFTVEDFLSFINATGSHIRFFESGGRQEDIPLEQRVYGDKFAQATSRFIHSELDLDHPPLGKRVDFKLHVIILRSDGTALTQQDMPSFILPDRSGSNHYFVWGAANPGSWIIGEYTIVFTLDGIQIARATFTIE